MEDERIMVSPPWGRLAFEGERVTGSARSRGGTPSFHIQGTVLHRSPLEWYRPLLNRREGRFFLF